MKKAWISVKCGLSRDPKHRRQMGKSIWTFLHMLDLADWETGIVYDWKDENAAEDMGIDVRVLREDRRKLDDEGYISCKQKQYGQEITIHNWTNPREYSGEVYNKKQGDKKHPPSKNAQGDVQGYPQGYVQGSVKDVTPTSSSNNQISTEKMKDITESANRTVEAMLELERAAHAAETQGKAWKHREDFGFNEHVLAFADKCSQRFGAPSKRDITVWVLELGSWVDAGARVIDWERAEDIVAGYSQPVLTVTGMTKAVKFAAQERKNGTAPQSREPREEDHPEWKKFVAPENVKYVPAPPRKRVAVS